MIEKAMNNSCFKDIVLEVYDEVGPCSIDMTMEELPGIVISLTIQEESDYYGEEGTTTNDA